MTNLELLEIIRKDIVDAFDGDPLINRACKIMIGEFEKRIWQLTLTNVSNSFANIDYWKEKCRLMEEIEKNNPCDPDINQEQINAYRNYHNFIKENGIGK